MSNRLAWLVLLCWISISPSVLALNITDEVQPVLPHASIYIESARALSEDDLRSDTVVEFFRPLSRNSLRTGPDIHPFWLNFELVTFAEEPIQRLLFIDSPYLVIDQIVSMNGQAVTTMGERSIGLTLPEGRHEFFVRFVPTAPTSLSLSIGSVEQSIAYRLQAGGVQAIMAGVLVAMAGFSMWYAIRQRNGLLFFLSTYFTASLFFFGAVWPYAVATVTPNTPMLASAIVLSFLLIFWLISSYMVRTSLSDIYYRTTQTAAITLLVAIPFLLWLGIPRSFYSAATALLCPIVLGTCLFGYRGQAPGLSALVASALAFGVWLILWLFEMRGESLAKPYTVPVFSVITMLHVTLLYHGVFSFSRSHKKQPLPVTPVSSSITTKLLKDISHSLNNRINGLTGTMDMLAQTGLANQHAEWFGTIDLSVLQLESLCDELNTITLLQDRGTADSRQRLLSPKQFDVVELIESCVDPFRQVAARLGVELIADLEQVTHSARIGPDEAIRRCIKIILGRAIDASATGDEIILTALAANDRDCRFRIQARGMTMSASDIQSLMHTNHEQPRALGLQLAVHLAKQFDAELHLTGDSPGVSFVLPIQLAIPFEQPTQATIRSNWQLPSGMRVLVVDDSLTCRRTLQPMLQQLQLRVEVADNIQTALATIETQYHMDDPFEVILCDHQLGNYPGLQLVRELKQGTEPWQKRMMIVLMSGTPKFELPDEYRQLGVKHVVEKPVFMHSLRKTLEHAYNEYLRGSA
ncbi:response regulator [Salinibius halmophilus]|uniref:response regulator n=1 Tax=Salinibius halmophilus TaxID=1853216 RepID=UPI000E6751DC|nr:response regulator [Salinibius halmophilus]